MSKYGTGPEADTIRARRRALRQNEVSMFFLRFDPLAERAYLLAYWRAAGYAHIGPVCESLYRNPAFARLLMPRVRAMLDARLREPMLRMQRATVEAAAQARAAKAPQRDMFAESA